MSTAPDFDDLAAQDAPTKAKRRAGSAPTPDTSPLNLVDAFAATYPFPLDPFQRLAIEALNEGNSVLVAAPTGTGKTVVAEFAIWLALRDGKRVFYTAPLKALSNQKYRDFRARYGEQNVGLMTGDIVENPTAAIVVMTTEIYRNVLLELERDDSAVASTGLAGSVAATPSKSGHSQMDPQLARVATVIFDELHFMADPQRGPVWEECIIHSPPHVRFVGLSATVHNANELINWMTQVHAPTKLIFHPERAVPLEDYYFYEGQLALVRDANGERVRRFPHIGGEAKRRSYHPRWRTEDTDENDRPPYPEAPLPSDVLAALKQAEMLPCLYFLPGRKAVEEAARSCAMTALTARDDQRAIAAQVEEWISALNAEDRALQQVQELGALLPLGIAFHHAGLLPSLKMLVEMLFASGKLQAVFATDTLALGVNMPARAVVLGSMSKFDGTGMRLMTPNEYNQLTGRAGRRGLDPRGAAVILYSPWDDFESCFRELTKELLPVISAFTMRYNSVLNLWRPNAFERLRRIASASFLEYQRRERLLHSTAKKKRKAAKITKERGQPITRDEPVDPDMVQLGGGVEQELIATTTVLRIFNYISAEDDALTLKGRLLRSLFHSAGLILTELMLTGGLDDLTSTELGEVVSWFVYDSDKPLWSVDILSDRLKIARKAAYAMANRVRRTEIQQHLPPSPDINERFMGVALGWAQGLSLAGLRSRIGLAEGDLLMVLNQTIDLLRQLESAIGQTLGDQDLWSPYTSTLSWGERRELRQRLAYLKDAMRIAARGLLRSTVAQSRSLPFRAVGLPVPPTEAADGEDDEAGGSI